ncbi:CBS domain-containing protein [Micromonospora sp. CPCC 205546]|uniref:restriction system modified-DNA reader domain-containing protein n=1 Tax=Micromonospora sp. CPCC 205546 TaxID=3122397 RepID=UPI002FEF7199
MNSTGQHICRNCGVICVRDAGGWVHPEPWCTLKAGRVCDQAQPLREATSQEAKRGAMQLIRRDRWMREEQLQQLAVPAGSDVEVAIVGCYQLHPTAHEHPRGWGYLASDGHYGFGATTTRRRFDGDGELAAEARSLFWALRKLVPSYHVTVVTDYSEIADMVNAWRAGDVTAAPRGYDRSDRPSGREAKLMYIAARVHRYADAIHVRLVDDYTDTNLGRGADQLSLIGWQWCAGEMTKTMAHELALANASTTLNVDPLIVPRQVATPDEEEHEPGQQEEPDSADFQPLTSPQSGSASMSASSSRSRRELLINGRRVRIADLIDARLLAPGTELTYQQRIGETPHRATVTARGQLRLRDGREFDTPSRAAATVAGVRAVPGWAVWHVQPGGQTLHQLRLKLLKDVTEEVTSDQTQEEAEAVRRRFSALEEARTEAEAGKPRTLTVREFIKYWSLHDRDRAANVQIDADLANHGLTTVPDFRAVSLDKTIRIVALPDDGTADTEAPTDGGKPTPSDINEESVDIGLTLGNLLPGDMSLVSVPPTASFERAITAMQVDDFSQLAVLADPHTLDGAVTWESIAAARHRDRAATFSDAIDRRARERVFDYDTRLLDVLETLQQDGFIFVRDDQKKISGIITAADVVRKYDDTATPFFLIGEIDQELRHLLQNTFDEETVRQACVSAKLNFKSFDSMSIGQYQAVLDNPECWKQLDWPLDRKTFIARLDELRKVRNNVMHFNPDPVRPTEVRKLRNFLRLIRQYGGR